MPQWIVSLRAAGVVAALASAGAGFPALAQDAPTGGGAAPGSRMTDMPASDQPCAPSSGSGTLSDKLARCGGVIAPPSTGIDSGIRKPAPEPTPHTTPVIPPDTNGVVPK